MYIKIKIHKYKKNERFSALFEKTLTVIEKRKKYL